MILRIVRIEFKKQYNQINNYAYSANTYQIYADMIAFDEVRHVYDGAHYFCAYFGRRDGKQYIHSHEEILDTYGANLRMSGRMPDALSGAMGNQVYIACFDTEKDLKAGTKYIFGTESRTPSKKVK